MWPGNLPFTATVESVQRHFASLKPISVRLGKKRDDPTKTRGFAFVEFATIGHMKTALEHFHHSEIDDGKGGKRKINVELTYGDPGRTTPSLGGNQPLTWTPIPRRHSAGGGGKNSKRRERIKAKNEKLNERRQKRLKAEQEAKAAKKAQAGNDAKGNSSSSKPEEEALVDKDHADVHPSRRNQVQLADRKRRKKHN